MPQSKTKGKRKIEEFSFRENQTAAAALTRAKMQGEKYGLEMQLQRLRDLHSDKLTGDKK